VATIEWLRLLPNEGPFPQLWHILAIGGCSLEDGLGGGGGVLVWGLVTVVP
jgi:hypothetical protein